MRLRRKQSPPPASPVAVVVAVVERRDGSPEVREANRQLARLRWRWNATELDRVWPDPVKRGVR